MMGAPLMCTVALFKTPDILVEINQISGTDYLFHDGQDIQLDLGNISLQCGRRVDALKLWLAWKYYGDEGYEKNIDRLFALAGYAAKKVEQSAQLRLINDVKSLNICFQIRPENVSEDAYNDITVAVRNHMVETGGPMVNYAYINSDLVIRLITANFELRETHLDQFFDQVNKAVDFVLAKK
jgi:glutamate/tyrosine decarboxylase-like PLP-dependent enzyme